MQDLNEPAKQGRPKLDFTRVLLKGGPMHGTTVRSYPQNRKEHPNVLATITFDEGRYVPPPDHQQDDAKPFLVWE